MKQWVDYLSSKITDFILNKRMKIVMEDITELGELRRNLRLLREDIRTNFPEDRERRQMDRWKTSEREFKFKEQEKDHGSVL